ncbi:ATP-dependent helicase [Providencia heimbachae]|uniref:DNA 3'-5' helicase n=1 Tax=Providencia heimbachae ATCC 35613 TaxID=1354272 RepID=A0A1B7K2Y5_9GAMM|nr:ATP-dependent helicase [Providencia heimbachae]OAT54506.1 ATP-dependent DNA helicase [Providencia heimbachae ATCC 35613]SQH13556.1 DNA helicase II [Providencia heimbachae]
MNLSEVQQQIVNAPLDSAIQVLAAAGSGKTRVLTERIRYIVEQTKKDQIIALTFTNKAAEEMQARLSDDEQIENRVWIATIHSVAQRILESYGHTIGLPEELHIYERDQDRMEVFLQSLRDRNFNVDKYLDIEDRAEKKNRTQKISEVMNSFSKIKRQLLTEMDVVQQNPNSKIWHLYEDYQLSLINSGGIDYDDILVYAHKILLTHEWIANIYRTRYKHICVDEAQDLNKAQYEFIKAFCGESIKSVLMVGDPNQMIYGFNGSSTDYFCKSFINDFEPKKFILNENYRSSKAVIDFANKLRPNTQQANQYALQGIAEIHGFENEQDEALAVVNRIQKICQTPHHNDIEGEITLNKIVIIARNRFIFSQLEEKLIEHNIPFSFRKNERQVEPITLFAKVLDYAIRLKINPKDWVNGKKLCQLLEVPIPQSWDANVLITLANEIENYGDSNRILIANLLASINKLNIEKPNIRKFVSEFEQMLSDLPSQNTSFTDEQLEDVNLSLEELKEFGTYWTLFSRKNLGESLSAFRNALTLGQLCTINDDNGLTLSTVHTMKGLEKDIVFLIGMCEGVFPDYRAKTNPALEEERNNAFVAITRAKRWLFISYPKQRKMPWGDNKHQQKSRFITEIES